MDAARPVVEPPSVTVVDIEAVKELEIENEKLKVLLDRSDTRVADAESKVDEAEHLAKAP